MIDLHLHLLPGVDDGPVSTRESLEMAEALVEDGVEVAIVTPHVRRQQPSARPQEIAGRARELKEAIRAAGHELEVLPGAEVDLLWALDAAEDDMALVTLADRGTDILLETPFTPLPASFEQMVLTVAERGYRVTLAHPERNVTVQADPLRLSGLVDAGVLVQVTARSLLRKRGSRSGRAARDLLKAGLVHVVASDAHRASGLRGPALSLAREELRRLAPGIAAWLMHEVPAAIVAGEPLPGRPMRPQDRRGWLARRRHG